MHPVASLDTQTQEQQNACILCSLRVTELNRNPFMIYFGYAQYKTDKSEWEGKGAALSAASQHWGGGAQEVEQVTY